MNKSLFSKCVCMPVCVCLCWGDQDLQKCSTQITMKMNMSSTVLLFAIKKLINLRWPVGLFGGYREDKCCLSPITVESLSKDLCWGERKRERERKRQMQRAKENNVSSQAKTLSFESMSEYRSYFQQIFCSIMQKQKRFFTDKFEGVWFGCSKILCGKMQAIVIVVKGLWKRRHQDWSQGIVWPVRIGVVVVVGLGPGGKLLQRGSNGEPFHISTLLSSSFAWWGIAAQPMIFESCDILVGYLS